LELKSSRSFLAIKHCQWTKSKKVIKLARSSFIIVAHICPNRGIPVKAEERWVRGERRKWGRESERGENGGEGRWEGDGERWVSR
jgi:hypothetical protein